MKPPREEFFRILIEEGYPEAKRVYPDIGGECDRPVYPFAIMHYYNSHDWVGLNNAAIACRDVEASKVVFDNLARIIDKEGKGVEAKQLRSIRKSVWPMP